MSAHSRGCLPWIAWFRIHGGPALLARYGLLLIVALLIGDRRIHAIGGLPLAFPFRVNGMVMVAAAIVAVVVCTPELPPLPRPLRVRVATAAWAVLVQLPVGAMLFLAWHFRNPRDVIMAVRVFLVSAVLGLVTVILGYPQMAWLPPVLLSLTSWLFPWRMFIGGRVVDFNMFAVSSSSWMPVAVLGILDLVCCVALGWRRSPDTG